MPEIDDYFREVDVNKWSYDGCLKFLTTEKCINNLLQKNETHFLRNLFPPANVEVDEEINGYLDNIISIFKDEEKSKEVEQKQKLVNLGIKTFKECQITFIFDTVQKL
ncbi:1475_t:CDS:2 [Racocetra fulgida]|uniref:1475_t:CDS:1 n=1 Tax=Racocetra fulgida TaxID=60492 RepID=A0A9N8ZWE5_9GLOM|nr:1475_t:CDS:2 [Racocetra fulgida]